MDFSRRLKLYLMGVLIGGVLAWLFYGQRLINGAWTPEARVKLRLYHTLSRATPDARQRLQDSGVTVEALRKAMNEPATDLTDIDRRGDSLLYTFEAVVNGGRMHFVVCALRDYRTDSMATVVRVEKP